MIIEHAKTLHGNKLHINVFDYSRNTIACEFFNLAFQISVFPVIIDQQELQKLGQQQLNTY